MNKYIRTKNGIYEVIKNDFGVCIKIDCMFILLDDIKDKIIKEADTIDELCDMTIVVDDERPDKIFELEWYIDEELLRKYNDVKGVYIYGAVWCEWGLKYVAKMNEKGELVLI